MMIWQRDKQPPAVAVGRWRWHPASDFRPVFRFQGKEMHITMAKPGKPFLEISATALQALLKRSTPPRLAVTEWPTEPPPVQGEAAVSSLLMQINQHLIEGPG